MSIYDLKIFEAPCKLCGHKINKGIEKAKECVIRSRNCNQCLTNKLCITLTNIQYGLCKDCYQDIIKDIEMSI